MTSTQILQNINVWRRKKYCHEILQTIFTMTQRTHDEMTPEAKVMDPIKKTQALQILFAMSPLRQPLMP